MKLAKLSLATIVAVGAMSTFASATPLEEAIKGVELNGFIRYRYYDRDGANEAERDEHRYTVITDFTIPVAENLKAGLTLNANGKEFARNNAAAGHDDISYGVDRAWFQYGVDGFSAKVGRFNILSPWTDPSYRGSVGNGVLALYSGVPGWTFGGAAFVNTNLDPAITGNLKNGTFVYNTKLSGAGIDIGQENLYALAAIGAMGPVNLQVWAASMTNVVDYTVYGDLQFAMAGFNARLQASTLKLADEADVFADDTGVYFGATVGYEAAGFSGTVGYTKNDDDQPIYNLADDDSSGYIFFGQQLGAISSNMADAQVIFLDLGYTVGKFALAGGYGRLDVEDTDANEWYGQVGYNYSKNFNVNAYYSSFNTGSDWDADNDEIRFEAKYSF